MRRLKRHVAPRQRAAKRNLLQKIPHQQSVHQVLQVKIVIQIHATVIAVVAAGDEDVVAHKVKVLKDPMWIQMRIRQKNQKMVQRPTQEMAPRIAVAVAVVQQEKMSRQERQLMKMALSQL
jgi:hypothetical protein